MPRPSGLCQADGVRRGLEQPEVPSTATTVPVGRSAPLIAISSGVLLNRMPLGHSALNSPDVDNTES
ncbi:MAG TPA: hypothetical protein VFX16_01935 [Pseudonocardiaceae bacterium]|nr:hypothetical protein [Pseudonocardiaceae bacterium]